MFGPLVGWCFIGTGLYAQRRRPESRAGTLMVVLGFAWFSNAIGTTDVPLLYTLGLITGGSVGRRVPASRDHVPVRAPVGGLGPRGWSIAGYLIFTLANVPAMLVAGPSDFGCDDCPENLLLIERDEALRDAAFALQAALYAGLFLLVLGRLALRWRRTPVLERLQLTPVYASGLLTFLLYTVATAAGGDAAIWPAFAATALLPFAFLGGLLRNHVARLDADLRASRLRLVEAGDTERRRLERNLHDGAQARLVALALQLGHARRVADSEPQRVPELLDGAMEELRTSLAELRELAHGIHPAVLSEKGLDAALYALASRAPAARHARQPERRPAAGAGRGRGLLRGLRGADQRRQVRERDPRRRGGAPRERHADGRRHRRRGRRRRRGARLGPARARGPRRRARRQLSVESPPGRGTRAARARSPAPRRPRAAAGSGAAGSPRRPRRRAPGGRGSSSSAGAAARRPRPGAVRSGTCMGDGGASIASPSRRARSGSP